jgi:hypothetical protein
MMRTRRGMRSMTVAGLLAVLGLASAARAQEEKVPLHRVPGTVLKSAKARFPGAEIKQATKETEDGEPVFALGMKHHRHVMDVTFKVDGTVVLVETDVTAKEVPKVVLEAIQQSYPGATVRGAESVIKGPEVKKADYYQFYLLTAGTNGRWAASGSRHRSRPTRSTSPRSSPTATPGPTPSAPLEIGDDLIGPGPGEGSSPNPGLTGANEG